MSEGEEIEGEVIEEEAIEEETIEDVVIEDVVIEDGVIGKEVIEGEVLEEAANAGESPEEEAIGRGLVRGNRSAASGQRSAISEA